VSTLLYDPSTHHDACGVGFIVDRRLRSTHRMLRTAVQCLANLDHRGAISADGTGDGAGLLTEIPHALLARDLANHDIEAPAPGWLGVATVFLPGERVDEAKESLERAMRAEGLSVLLWRLVPTDPAVLGEAARATMPRIFQALIGASQDVADVDDLERRLFLGRKGAERSAAEAGLVGFAVPSSSARTVVYKGLFTAKRIDRFYLDLIDPSFGTSYAIFHQRYSTNTFPSWERAQPFRLSAHNGEINTISSNRAWMATRQVDLRSPVWGDRTKDLVPLLEPEQSDSGHLDNAIELLVRSGRSLAHAKEMLIPSAWENVADLDPELLAFYEYHAFLTEPWDGPVALAATDGVTLLAAVDRNGLRPARWTITPDTVIVASEAGIAPQEEVAATATGQLGPGELVTVDLSNGEIRFAEETRAALAGRRPYGDWISTHTAYIADPFDDLQDERFDPEALSRVFGYTAEERRLVLAPMAEGRLPVGAMGNDTPLAVLSERPERLTRYFHQLFAQVTNPAMDPIRERLVMSLRTYLGRRGSLLEETPQQARLMQLPSPVLSDADVEQVIGSKDEAFRTAWLQTTFTAAAGAVGMRTALAELCRRAEAEVRDGTTVVVLSDRDVDADRAPIPALLATGAVHHRLIEAGLRLRASIVVVSGEPRDEHDLGCLIAFGASAVNPYLAIEQVRAMAARGEVDVDPVLAQENYRSALEMGLLKIFSKMGICTISAYRGSELFEIVGLDEEVAEMAFAFADRRIDGAGLDDIARMCVVRHARYGEGAEEVGGYYKQRRGGVPHVNSPKAGLALQRAVRAGDPGSWQAYLDEIDDHPPTALRDLLGFTAAVDPVPLAEVEPVEAIMARFTTAAISHGAISAEAHQTLAEAMDIVGGLSNSGEGGEDPDRYGTARNSRIKQVASGRFGVTPAYLASADEFQIKMAQGSKPGEGGQLPGFKVTPEIARLRNTEPGISLISPPPHHDIYSIEDLAQLIFDLKTFKPTARVSVKLVSRPGVGTVAVGVAKARADVVLISGGEGGTGASPLSSMKHAGSPWELGLAEAQQALVANGMRERITLETDGGLRSGRDVVIAALLGAGRFGFGTLPLVALGCKMVRSCNENTCPVGIATQDADLRAKYTGSVEHVVELFRLLAEDVRHILAALGARSIGEVIGRADLLVPRPTTAGVTPDLSRLLVRLHSARTHPGFQEVERSAVGDALAADWSRAIEESGGIPERFEVSYPVTNRDRAVGSRLSGLLTELFGKTPLRGSIDVRLSGTAGQSLGAFLADGVDIRLDGTANDYVGKGMGGGRIVIVPRHAEPGHLPHGAGNAVLYGATAGSLFVAGRVGQRFAVRNSGAVAVVEGCSDHGGEYMTGGTVAILGAVGRNLGAGMTGGVLFVWDPAGVVNRQLAETAPSPRRADAEELEVLRLLISGHVRHTDSSTGRALLADWATAGRQFWVLQGRSRPPAPVAIEETPVVAPVP
jgi:glutamate synthase domain-containing protein 2/glutamate synthase domain-containing protein 1/glutamate synthase domain-containing protein 3